MKKSRKICLLLIFVTILSLLSGCKTEPSGNTDGTNDAANSQDNANGDADAADAGPIHYAADYLPDITFDGYEFRIVTPATIGGGIYNLVFADVEEETGDTMDDALYKRNRLVEAKYDIKIKQVDVPDIGNLTPTFTKSVKAASDDFDLCMLISRDAWSQAISGAIVPVSDLPYLDVTQPWYAQEVNNQLSINNKFYFAYSDECLNMFAQTICTVFNKKIAQDLALENIYELVRTNKWTLAKFFELARAAVLDLNGDGEMTDTDRYGILSQTDFFYPHFWVGSGLKTVGKDENDLLVFTGNNEKLYSVLERVSTELFGGEKIFFDGIADKSETYKDPNYRFVSINQFKDDLGLFFLADIFTLPFHFRDMESDFGIVPFPKYDENQDKYYSRVVDGWINSAPNFTENRERTSIIMEALAVESKNITVPAFFEVMLQRKYTRDEESLDMLEIIHANRTVDLGDTFYMEAVRNVYVSVFTSKKTDFASAIEKKMGSIEKALNKANDAALALN